MASPDAERTRSYLDVNRSMWDGWSDEYVARAWERWRDPTFTWGIWRIPESELEILGDVEGKDVLEYGCGAAQCGCRLAVRGARVVGIDLSARQLEHARRLQAEYGVEFPLVHGNAEETPFPDEAFDVVFCDHGGMTWCDPLRSVREVARLLRPSGLLAFNITSSLAELCYDMERITEGLQRDYFGLHRIEEPDAVSFNLPYGEWIRLFGEHGLQVEGLVELRPPEGADPGYWDYMTTEWARRWPSENIWKVRKPPP